jgi:hypothetical protein
LELPIILCRPGFEFAKCNLGPGVAAKLIEPCGGVYGMLASLQPAQRPTVLADLPPAAVSECDPFNV